MTREEHIRWSKKRALDEMAYSHDPKQAVISMMSDIGKHPETNSDALRALCMSQLLGRCTEASVRDFINGFN